MYVVVVGPSRLHGDAGGGGSFVVCVVTGCGGSRYHRFGLKAVVDVPSFGGNGRNYSPYGLRSPTLVDFMFCGWG
jgi:hypothetical protein